MSGQQTSGEVEVIVYGEPFAPLPESVLQAATKLEPLTLYINHSLILRQIFSGASTDYKLAKSYASRSLQYHPKEKKRKKTNELQIEVEENGLTELFWCYFISQEYFSLLNEVTIPLNTEETYEISYWDDENLAHIEIAETLEDAISKVNQKHPSPKNKVIKSSHPNQHNIIRGNDFVASILMTPTNSYRQYAIHTRLQS